MLVAEKVVLNVLRLPVEGDGTNVDTVCKSKGSDQGDDRTRRTQLLTTPDLSLGVSARMYPRGAGQISAQERGRHSTSLLQWLRNSPSARNLVSFRSTFAS